jgi:hypothetical protein
VLPPWRSLSAFDLKGAESGSGVSAVVGGDESPRTFAYVVTVPYFARISGNGITWEVCSPDENIDPGTRIRCTATAGRAHGNSSSRAMLTSACGCAAARVPPFDYESSLQYRLEGATLECRLSIR